MGTLQFAGYSDAISEMTALVENELRGKDEREYDRARFFLHSALTLADEMWFQKGDPAQPEFTDWELPWRKYGGDNPGTVYLSAPVHPDGVYRVTGVAPEATYIGIQVYGRGSGYNAPTGNVGGAHAAPHGPEEIDVAVGGPAREGHPWVPLAEADYVLIVRLYYSDIRHPRPDVRITRVGGDVPSMSSSARSRNAVHYFRDEVLSTIGVTDALRTASVNSYPPADAAVHRPRYTGALFPTRDNTYDGCWVSLGDGESLRVRGTMPDAVYTSFVFYDRWFNTSDYRVTRCFRTARDIVASADGHYELVLGPDPSDHPNWIDTGGLREGIFAIRNLLMTSRTLPTIEVATT
ncbi:hypothetical protein HDC37_002675 [Microbacterium sp. AK009]|uniref:DUF1214 domain-containing protein n=1 Tax=Microbacterium sp. AK009 TaxID=2723068 RepID=UPI0015C810A7|nr:DUF1214 domain-containing protein [Microbacterium sp. AK009]NYF17830.1 hypothetical protein [Microbacterium sp. AK009]